ncbi:ribosomal protein L17 [Dacryopinax primogenitus]|uniref:Ribosomal protein L17 n=1 Tax=Dacryopinax primogenitus (strain DJM 731) TaxID=1858805 RepID=M5FUE5_DACPD|nr:ribosomal protein L17 [Dacryopinax primogenitus]EJT99843.1 ribosomal protein L17 [Dacryopinax primogenitus]
MRHGKAHRKLSRPSAHRMLMLRNLVSSLLQHQQITTTLAKAREAQPLAEKMITLGKKGTLHARKMAEQFVLNPKDTLPLLFGPYATRYAHRPGGYVRIHKSGNRFGDNAPLAILELVDNPRDLRFAMTARAVGRETLGWRGLPGLDIAGEGQTREQEVVAREPDLAGKEVDRLLREKTRLNRAKVLRYRGKQGREELNAAARGYVDELLAQPEVLGGPRRLKPAPPDAPAGGAWVGKKVWAGERTTGMGTSRVGLGIALGTLGRRKWVKPVMRGWDKERERKVDSELDEMELLERREREVKRKEEGMNV